MSTTPFIEIGPGPSPSDSVPPWTALERESFFAAIERHRRAAWRVTALSILGNAALAFVVATLMSPLFYAVIALALDLINLATPTPNLVDTITHTLDPMVDHPETVPLGRWLQFALIAALPGLVWMGLLVAMLARVLNASASFASGELQTREPDTTVLAEQRFSNVIGEMALAAALPAPRVLVTDRPALNAAVIGRDERDATVVVSSALLAALDREQMQGIAAHLIATIADADMVIGMRAALTLSLFGTIARFSSLLSDEGGLRKLGRMGWALVHPTGRAAQELAASVADPFEPDEEQKLARRASRKAAEGQNKKRDWRLLIWAPLAGPVVFTGFLGGLVSTMILAPLLALAWRQRKYMADAIAVRLTRDPDTLAKALERIGGGSALAPWASHLSVAASGASGSWLGTSFVPMIPSVTRRLRALQKLGAHVETARRPIPWRLVLVLSPLVALAGVLLAIAIVLLAWISIPISMLMTGLPFSVVHLLLRWLGH